MKNRLVVSISDMKISRRPRDMLVTHSLGSCLGLAAYDPAARVGGLIHCLLPRAVGPNVENPYMYVNVGVPLMIRKLASMGCAKEGLVFKAAGCGRMNLIQNQFDTGAQNMAMLESLFTRNGVVLAAQDVGGTIPRTLMLDVETGKVTITSQGQEWEI
ncbi:chemotaxis protein CheD [Fundidesulfovibrio soli]|uniref:chemotaxis protein CheD n=1 Tax=Fundidesulfovibrio soli TaxID=2922716 RepID=UPI00301477B0